MRISGYSQIVVDPSAGVDHEKVLESADRQNFGYAVLGPISMIKLRVSRYLHPLIHTWVDWLQYDPASDKVLETGMEVCLYCSKGRV